MPEEVWIIECTRSPIGRGYANGALNSVHPGMSFAVEPEAGDTHNNENKCITSCHHHDHSC
jgi:hypothetical protein